MSLASFYLSEASRLCGNPEYSNAISQTEALRNRLFANWPYDNIVLSEITNRGPRSVRISPATKGALTALVEHPWAVPLETGTVVRSSKRG
ncbi:hypothetical protein SAMN06265373_10119 [Shimia sagamensis]|uniref:Uncharacterized protein n=1 Tax=Shimia sagamensis TaxID=1566352 RepID=A0ABY1N612_9RHOB|nr:hypothetical protein SAMN06265373_10119 [Shimia sagamensis]